MQEMSMVLRDGRRLGYWGYGDETGTPIMLFHGTPGSRIWFLEDDELAKAMGIYLISIDRPGYGLSTFQYNRTILDWAVDVEELASHLGLNRFSVLGVSGGGPFAAACAFALSDRIYHTALVSSATPFRKGKAPKEMAKENRIAFFLTKYFPWVIRKANLAQKKMLEKNPAKYKSSMLTATHRHLSKWDRELLKEEPLVETSYYHAKEAYRQGVEGVMYETQLLSKEWGFEISEIRSPLRIWHGEKDTLSPVSEIRKLAAQSSSTEITVIDEGGHFLTENEELWADMLRYLKGSRNDVYVNA
ncbi:alpha/beta fold hydrolase [Pseudalkalibacillus hwajinpoensis]|uniref:alpha/beta fold hydrolase n=1 Tax=Guptibacillus hwajinpoensis TaxID=208199 RepID=UPI001CD79191|nr:alpha/beta hydrolase [Pseudalkalibacillus hwajinpoensis]MCA0989730.1 alpha/beta hydrolase [Pseudalkalibacillus hwajinpoensis]